MVILTHTSKSHLATPKAIREFVLITTRDNHSLLPALLVSPPAEMHTSSHRIVFPFPMPGQETLVDGLRRGTLLLLPQVEAVHLARKVLLAIVEVLHFVSLWRVEQRVRKGCFEFCAGSHTNCNFWDARRTFA